MDNQHQHIKGYRDLSRQEIDAMNSIKLLEEDVANLWKQVSQIEGVDHRALAQAEAQLKQAFMWFVRGVAQPYDPFGAVQG